MQMIRGFVSQEMVELSEKLQVSDGESSFPGSQNRVDRSPDDTDVLWYKDRIM